MLVKLGGSIARSTALHIACEKNCIGVVKLLLQMDSDCSKTKDKLGRTPLIVAAMNATGRLCINGIDDTEIIDTILLTASSTASSGGGKRKRGTTDIKSEVDSNGMTAYGYFKKSSKTFIQMTHYQHRHKITNLEKKLYPPGGPTAMDLAEGRGGTSGFVDYDQVDREIRIGGAYGDSDDEDY
jgi:hypothetical protein